MADLTKNMNFLQPTGFKVVIDRKNYPNLEYFVQSTNLPGVSSPAVEIGYPRANIHMTGGQLDYDEITMDIILDENMDAYTEMYSWMERNAETKQTTLISDIGKYNTQADAPTTSDITLLVLSSHNNKTKKITYRDCIPVQLGAVQLMSNVADVQYIILPVTFSFTYFEIL